MEGNNRYNRTGNTDYRNHQRGDERPLDQDAFRGAYRFDNDSNHHNETTYDGFDRNDRDRNDYRNDNRGNQRNAFDREDHGGNSRYQHGGSSQNRDWDEQYRPSGGRYGARPGGSRNTDSVRSRIGDSDDSAFSNFNSHNGRDNYGYSGGENAGNMAGSLSYGYDGNYISDPDANRYYDPLSGRRHSYHGNYTSRHPGRGQHRQDAGRHSPDDWDNNRY